MIKKTFLQKFQVPIYSYLFLNKVKNKHNRCFQGLLLRNVSSFF